MRQINIDGGFYLLVKPQSLNGEMTASFNDLVVSIDDDLDDELIDQQLDDDTGLGVWITNGTVFNGVQNQNPVATLDFCAKNGDFTHLSEMFKDFVADPEISKILRIMDEHYGRDSYEIRLGAFANYS